MGNVRLSYSYSNNDGAIATTEILEENHYYPFGLKHKGYTTEVSSNYKYKLNSKEYQDELELNVYDMDMRQYDPAIGRWAVLDPVVHYEESPYTAFGNNPVFYADPSGADPYESQVDRSGEMSNSEWTAQNRRDIDKQLGGNGVDVATGTYSTAEERVQNEQENNNSTDGGDSEPDRSDMHKISLQGEFKYPKTQRLAHRFVGTGTHNTSVCFRRK